MSKKLLVVVLISALMFLSTVPTINAGECEESLVMCGLLAVPLGPTAAGGAVAALCIFGYAWCEAWYEET